MADEREIRMLDSTGATEVEVLLSEDQKTIWVNIDGICRLRTTRFKRSRVVCGDKVVVSTSAKE